MQTKSFKIAACDARQVGNKIVVYKAGSGGRVIDSREYDIGRALILTFDASGRLYEAGKDILPSQNEYYGAQTRFYIPQNGFSVLFDRESDPELTELFRKAFDGIMLYNATLSMTYDMTAHIDGDNVVITCGDPLPETENTKKFLFVGNSSTYFNGTPVKFEALCRSAGLDVKAEYCTFGSAYLSEFADETHKRGMALRQKLLNKKYDFVVLQDAAAVTLENTRSSLETILPLVRANGAEPLLYMRHTNTLSGIERLCGIYSELSERFGIKTCCTASAFAKCMREHGEIELFAEDGSHHSREGSYLVACSWLCAFCDTDPRGNAYTAGIDAAVARTLQNEAYNAYFRHCY